MSTAAERVDPPRIADERPMLESWLDYWRASHADLLRERVDGATGE
jgi:hypothetical protein